MISIYDFSILPYALGDVLTWNVKQCVKARNAGQKDISVHVCNEGPTNIHQDKYINETNSQSYLTDLIPAFYTNPMLSSFHIWRNRNEMLECLEGQDAIDHKKKMERSRVMLECNKILFEDISSHYDINSHTEKGVPQLIAPMGFDKNFDVFKEMTVPEYCIAVHLRARSVDTTLGSIEIHRDSNLDVWTQFFTRMRIDFPNVRFVLVGKPGERIHERINLSNVIYPRIKGWTLTQELSLITRCSSFMGSCSGFAAMAAFTKTPYLITKCDERSYKNYGIPFGSNKLPFATDKQFLVHGEETVDMLMAYFKLLV